MSGNVNYAIPTGVWTKDNGIVIVPPGNSWAGNDSNPKVNPLTLADGSTNPNNIKGKNNILQVDRHCIGPLPPGLYKVGEWAFTAEDIARLGYPTHLGLGITSLTQIGGETYGRDGFFIHGPGKDDYGQESEGCTVVTHDFRLGKLAAMKPDTVTVTAA